MPRLDCQVLYTNDYKLTMDEKRRYENFSIFVDFLIQLIEKHCSVLDKQCLVSCVDIMDKNMINRIKLSANKFIDTFL